MSSYEKIWNDWRGSASSSSPPIEGGEEEDSSRRCLDCHQESVFSEDGAMVCLQCGFIQGNILDSSAEWRYYGNDDHRTSDPNRCGLPSNHLNPDANLGSLIGYRPTESFTMKRIRQYHSWNTSNYRGRTLYNQFELLQLRCELHGIPKMILEHTKTLYKKITDEQLFRGENKNGLMAICMFKACKDRGVPRSIKEIALIFDVDEQTMTKGNRCFTKVWNLLDGTEGVLARPLHYVERFCSRLNMPTHVMEETMYVAELVDAKKLVTDNTPSSISTAVIYLVCQLNGLDIIKADIAKVSQISEVTIGKCYKKLAAYSDFISAELVTRSKGR